MECGSALKVNFRGEMLTMAEIELKAGCLKPVICGDRYGIMPRFTLPSRHPLLHHLTPSSSSSRPQTSLTPH